MKKYRLYIVSIIVASIFLYACDKNNFLDFNPKGSISGKQLNTPEKVDKMVTAAYATVGAAQWRAPYVSQWLYGSVRSDDAYKAGGGIADQRQWNIIERFTQMAPDVGGWAGPDQMWFRLYFSIQRANNALSRLKDLTEEEFPKKTERMAEMRFLRGHFYFRLKVLFKHVPYIDETVPRDSLKNISNREFTSQELWDKIAADFQYAADNLPPSQEQVGRADRYEALAYLAKTRLFQAYKQNNNHDVVNIQTEYLQEVVDLTNQVINSGKYGLFDDIRKNFLWEFENGKESIFAAQYSINDGTPMGNIDMGEALNYHMAPEYGCCSFHAPSQNLINGHKTDPTTGYPMFDTFNESSMTDSEDFWNNTVDPRLDHTVGIPSHPFKYDTNFVYQEDWARAPGVYGHFQEMRSPQHPDCPCKTVAKGYTYDTDSHNEDIIRYDEVLLWKAEALIQLGRENEALPIINQIRRRAKNSTDKLRWANGQTFSNYHVEEYEPGVWTQDFAWKALKWERRLEFATEGRRFYDLVRWGIAAENMNEYFKKEEERRNYLKGAKFTEGKDEYLPIPQPQINLSKGLYEQNSGYRE